MENLKLMLNKVNPFLEKHIFDVVTQPTHNKEYNIHTKVKVKLTGVKNYINIGESKPHIQYTLYILPSNKESDTWYSVFAKAWGKDINRNTSEHRYLDICWETNYLLRDFLKYFSIEERVICTRIVNEVEPINLSESTITENVLDKTTRRLVQDVVKFFKYQRKGEFELPEDLSDGEMVYQLHGFENFTITLKLVTNNKMDGIDVDGDLYYDDGELEITIESNPNDGYDYLDILTQELNDIIRHELEHIKQFNEGLNLIGSETKNPEEYYSQSHELKAQRAGLKKRAKSEKLDFETVVRNWFNKNPNKHRLDTEQMERVIQKIISEK